MLLGWSASSLAQQIAVKLFNTLQNDSNIKKVSSAKQEDRFEIKQLFLSYLYMHIRYMKTEDCFVTDALREVYSLKRGERAMRAIQGFCMGQTSEAGHGQHEALGRGKAVCLLGYRALFNSSAILQ